MEKRNWSPEALVRHLVKGLVSQDAQIKVWTSGTREECTVHVCMDSKETNKLVGEGGGTAHAIHTLLDVVGKSQGQSVTLKMESLTPHRLTGA